MFWKVKNFLKCEGSQVSPKVFSYSAISGFVSPDDGDTNLLLNIYEQGEVSSKYMFCLADVSGSIVNVTHVFESSEGTDIPNFTQPVFIVSTVEAGLFSKQAGKVGGLGYGGQSNAVAVVGNSRIPLQDYVPSNLEQYKFQFDPADPRGTNYDDNAVLAYQEPVFFNALSSSGANCVGSHLYFGRWLLDNGHRKIRVLPAAEGGTGLGTDNGNGFGLVGDMWQVNQQLAIRYKGHDC